jgi:hypothetical protein
MALGRSLTAGILPDGECDPTVIQKEVGRLVGQLDSDQFDVRQHASHGLERLKLRPEAATILAQEFQRVLLSPNTSFEVRRQLERLRSGLPGLPVPATEKISADEIDRLVRQLEDNRYASRLGATRRLEWLLENPKLVCPILGRVKQRLNGDELSLDARRWIEPIYARARAAWLTSDTATWNLPPVSDSQISAWLDELTRPIPDAGTAAALARQQKVWRELSDLLARDEYVSKVKIALESRLAERGLAAPTAKHLRELVELTRPKLVAEFWSGRHHLNTQDLWIGVPSQVAGAPRPSHFDYIDDDVAFCVSGSSLSQGNYPVGIAIPHPNPEYPTAMFHLVNLSTPRHKMAYDYVARDEAKQLAQLTRRTLARFLETKQRMSLRELLLLRSLDPEEVSRFAGPYFLAVEDQAIPPGPLDAAAERRWLDSDPFGPGPAFASASRHGLLCEVLATEGTSAAASGLLQAIDHRRFLAPTAQAPHQFAWIAALAIAVRDPWPGVDAWLGKLIARTDPLVIGGTDAAQLGATAAALLAARHQQEPQQLGLKPVDDRLLEAAGLPGHRFATPAAPEQAQRWWTQRQGKDRP